MGDGAALDRDFADRWVRSLYLPNHDLPLCPGDSGGPIATPAGKPLGLNTGVRVAWTGMPTSLAIRPDPEWVSRAISQDLEKPK